MKSSSTIRIAFLAAVPLILAVGQAGGQAVPAGWRAVADDGRADGVRLMEMEPGWHLNSDPAALIFEADRVTGDTFRIEFDAFLFPGEPSTFGAFFGGRGLEPATYDFFEVLLDTEGRFSVGHRAGPEYHEVVPWTPHPSIAIPSGATPAQNEVGINVSPTRLAVEVNGVEVTGFEPPAYARFDGAAGIRVGERANVHVTRFDFPAVGTSAAR